jgi:uncharacterized membrane protein
MSADSTILVLVYPEPQIADEVMEAVGKLQSQSLIDIEDACAIFKDVKGHIKIHQSHSLMLMAATGGAILGAVLGMALIVPYVGAVIGAAAGALGGKLADIGIDDDFVKALGHEIGAKNSALFLLLRNIDLEKVIPQLATYGGKILHTSFAPVQEEAVIRQFAAAQGRSAELSSGELAGTDL